jgi:hypothetical protein
MGGGDLMGYVLRLRPEARRAPEPSRYERLLRLSYQVQGEPDQIFSVGCLPGKDGMKRF